MNKEPLFFDIETLPTNDEQVIKRLADSIRPPGNIKKKESIDAWMEENYEQELKEKIKKTSLDAAYGRVACIAWSNGIDEIMHTCHDQDEITHLVDFYFYVEKYGSESFCGHNISGFDLKFLKQRSMILGIKPPATILKAMNAKPWDDCIKDTMIMWDSDKNKMMSLDTMLWLFGVKHDMPDFNGSMVADTWKTNPQKVIDYCIADVKAERELYYKMVFDNPVF